MATELVGLVTIVCTYSVHVVHSGQLVILPVIDSVLSVTWILVMSFKLNPVVVITIALIRDANVAPQPKKKARQFGKH